jgi:hypothetical protein
MVYLTAGGVSPLSERKETMGRQRSSWCPSVGCLALGAERRRMEWSLLIYQILPMKV